MLPLVIGMGGGGENACLLSTRATTAYFGRVYERIFNYIAVVFPSTECPMRNCCAYRRAEAWRAHCSARICGRRETCAVEKSDIKIIIVTVERFQRNLNRNAFSLSDFFPRSSSAPHSVCVGLHGMHRKWLWSGVLYTGLVGLLECPVCNVNLIVSDNFYLHNFVLSTEIS